MKPLVAILDDDAGTTFIFERFLEKFGIDSCSYYTADDFLEGIQKRTPDLCLIDLNLTFEGEGYDVIDQVRRGLKLDLPIIVVSNMNDAHFFLKALHLGAHDYLVKPITKQIFVNKLLRFIETPELLEASSPLLPDAWVGLSIQLSVDFQLEAIDEFGIRIYGDHLLAKDLVLKVEGQKIQEITGSKKTCVMTIVESTFNSDSKKYHYYATFDPSNLAILTMVRRWIVNNLKVKESAA